MEPLRVAVVQTGAGADCAANLDALEQVVGGIEGADLIALPETFALRAGAEAYRRSAEPLAGPLVRRLGRLARRRKAWLLAGSIFERSGRRVFNTSLLLGPDGRLRASYRKIHLFEARLEDGRWIREADGCSAGRAPALATIGGWRAGLSICYDVRFPELYRLYADRGARLLLIPSNFTQRTGRDHWEVLVRARAIENQCYVVAPNQCGVNPATGVASHGHSLVVGPWGEVLCEAADRPAVLRAVLDPAQLRATRARIPALAHRILGVPRPGR